MVQITDKTKCCGCSACVQVCPKQCVSFNEDDKGFLYPFVNKDLCVDCGLCEEVCPFINENNPVTPLKVYAAKNPNENIRRESSSGGIFTMIAEYIIDEGGVVFGAKFDDNWNVIHSYTESKHDLKKFRGSKYVQSNLGLSYKEVRAFLRKGRKVLFTGTPCQIAGLKKFLRKDYDNLYTVDFICHGVPSPGIFRWFLQESLNNYAARKGSENTVSFSTISSIPKGDILIPEGMEIEDIRFRDKNKGWKKYSFVLQLAETSVDGKKNTVSLSSDVTNNVYLKGFCSDLYLRPSCHNCPTRNFKSGSDITLGDFWGQEYMFPEFDSDSGVSAVIVKTDKGRSLFSGINTPPLGIERPLQEVVKFNPSLISSKPNSYISKKFWRLPNRFSFYDRVKKARSLNIIERLYVKIQTLLKK